MDDSKTTSLQERLAEPFRLADLQFKPEAGYKSRDGSGHRVLLLTYVDARAIADRLDEAVGPMGWQDKYERVDGGTIASLGIYDADNDRWIWKQDGAPDTDMVAFKGGLSSALKRVAAKWGIGRYLYALPSFYVDVETRKPRHDEIESYIRVYGKFKVNGQQVLIKGWARKPVLPDVFRHPDERTGSDALHQGRQQDPDGPVPDQDQAAPAPVDHEDGGSWRNDEWERIRPKVEKALRALHPDLGVREFHVFSDAAGKKRLWEMGTNDLDNLFLPWLQRHSDKVVTYLQDEGVIRRPSKRNHDAAK